MNGNGDTQRGRLLRSFRRLAAATIALYVVLLTMGGVGLLYAARQRVHLEQVATSTNAALCALQKDLQVRVTTAEDFLEKFPHGIPGITAATLRASIHNQQSTLDALSILDCTP
jgi:hypothetical protein